MPGSRSSVCDSAVAPPGPTRHIVTVEGRTTLNESSCFSAIPSPFGETTESAGRGA